MDETIKLGLPYMLTNQAQKEVTYNEAMDLLDFFTGAAIIDFVDAIPSSGNNGDGYVLKSDNRLYLNVNGAWQSFTPYAGLSVFNKADNLQYYYHGGSWEVPEGYKLISLTQAEYDALTVKDSNTLYFIQEES